MNTESLARSRAIEIFNNYTQGKPYHSTDAYALDALTPGDVLDVILDGGEWGQVTAETQAEMSDFAAIGIAFDAHDALGGVGIGVDSEEYEVLFGELVGIMSERDVTDFLMISALAHGREGLIFSGTKEALEAIVGSECEASAEGVERVKIKADVAKVLKARREGYVFSVALDLTV